MFLQTLTFIFGYSFFDLERNPIVDLRGLSEMAFRDKITRKYVTRYKNIHSVMETFPRQYTIQHR